MNPETLWDATWQFGLFLLGMGVGTSVGFVFGIACYLAGYWRWTPWNGINR